MIKLILGALTSALVVSTVAAQDAKQPILRTDANFCQAFALSLRSSPLQAVLTKVIADGFGETLSERLGNAALPRDLTDLPYSTLNDLIGWADQCTTNLQQRQGMAKVYFQSVPTALRQTVQSKQRKDENAAVQAKEAGDFGACERAARSFREHNSELLPTLQASFPNVSALDRMSIANYKSLIDWTGSCYSRFYNQLGGDGHDAIRSYAGALSEALAAIKNNMSKLPQCDSNEIVALYKRSVSDGPLGKQGLLILDMNNVTTLDISDDLKTKACQAQVFTNAGKIISSFTIEFIDDKQIYLDVTSVNRAP